MSKSRPCLLCGQALHSVFEAVDHVTLYGENVFDPSIILPNGFGMHIGSLLRKIHNVADDPEQVRDVCESAYGILYLAETNVPALKDAMIELYKGEE